MENINILSFIITIVSGLSIKCCFTRKIKVFGLMYLKFLCFHPPPSHPIAYLKRYVTPWLSAIYECLPVHQQQNYIYPIGLKS